MVHSLREMPGPKWGIILYFLKKEQIFLGHEYNECSYVYSCYILLVLVRFDSVRFGSMVWIVCEIGGRRAGSQCRREWGLRRDSTSGSFANLQRGVEIRENEQWKKDEPRWIMLNCWITCFFTEERTRFDLPSSQVAKSRSHTWYGINHKYKYSIYCFCLQRFDGTWRTAHRMPAVFLSQVSQLVFSSHGLLGCLLTWWLRRWVAGTWLEFESTRDPDLPVWVQRGQQSSSHWSEFG